MTKKQKKALRNIIISSVLTAVAAIVSALTDLHPLIRAAIFAIPFLIIGSDVLKKAVMGVINGELLDENFLMSIATIGAFLLGEDFEGVAVMLFYQIGELFQSIAVGKARRSVSDLMDIRPDTAELLAEDGTVTAVSPDEVEIGSLIRVAPGEKIPLDGIIRKGESTLITSALTGESRPVSVTEGDEVLSGCINGENVLVIETTKRYDDSTVAKILELIENSALKKSRSEDFITKFARIYTPVVCACAVLLAIVPSLVTGDWRTWSMRALSFLVTSCPCALVVSVPLSFFGAIGGASSSGILIKGSAYLETLSNVDTLVMDKTGTLTKGSFSVTETVPADGVSKETLMKSAAIAETFSSHPIAAAVRSGVDISDTAISEGTNYSGKGVSVNAEGHVFAAGNAALMKELGAEPADPDSLGTVVHVCVDGVYLGYIMISDEIKPTSKEALSRLKGRGVDAVMLTGDRKEVAEKVAAELEIAHYKAELLPAGKVAAVEELLSLQKKGKALAFVGDGINDAPVIMRADIGIAMGALGSDAAIEAADVVLMDDDPLKIDTAIRIAKKCMTIVKENIIFAIGVKLLCLVAVALGIANMWWAVFSDVGVMVIAILNAVRMLKKEN